LEEGASEAGDVPEVGIEDDIVVPQGRPRRVAADAGVARRLERELRDELGDADDFHAWAEAMQLCSANDCAQGIAPPEGRDPSIFDFKVPRYCPDRLSSGADATPTTRGDFGGIASQSPDRRSGDGPMQLTEPRSLSV
jgi:hypothetical protein